MPRPIAAFPGHRERFRANENRLLARLDALHVELARLVRPIRRRPFVVLHDAFAYFVHRYGLRAAGAITVSPERRPGARRLARIRSHIRESGVPCVFGEPSFEPAFLRMTEHHEVQRLLREHDLSWHMLLL